MKKLITTLSGLMMLAACDGGNLSSKPSLTLEQAEEIAKAGCKDGTVASFKFDGYNQVRSIMCYPTEQRVNNCIKEAVASNKGENKIFVADVVKECKVINRNYRSGGNLIFSTNVLD